MFLHVRQEDPTEVEYLKVPHSLGRLLTFLLSVKRKDF